jgi:hypothetical protein
MKGGVLGGLILLLVSFVFAGSVQAASIQVPFKSQVPPGIWNKTLNCGQTSFLMVSSFLEGTDPATDQIKNIDNWLFEKYGDPVNEYSGSVTNVTKLSTLAKEYGGYESSYYGYGNLAWLKETIYSGQPVIIAVHIDMDVGKGGHFMVAVDIDDEKITVHDPGKTKGEYKTFSMSVFLASWGLQNNAYTIVKLNDELQSQVEKFTTSIIINPPSPPSFFQKIKSFFSNMFSDDTSPANTEEETTVEAESEESPEEPEQPVYKVLFLPQNIKLNIVEGQTEAKVIVFAKNIGNTTWQKQTTSINVVGGPASNQKFHHPSWLTKLRPTSMIEQTVAPGEVASFAFALSVPEDTTNVFKLQLVRQDGSSFFQVDNVFANISFQEKQSEIIEVDDPEVAPESEDTSFFEQLENIKDVLGDKIGEVFDDIADLVPDIFLFGGGGYSSNDVAEEVVVEEVSDEVEIVTPEITITTPTSTFVTTTLATTTITGTYNESVASITVNGTSTVDMASSTWSYVATLMENTTTTFTFVGWNTSSTVSSTEVSISFLYTSEEPDPPTITIISPTTSPYIVTSTPVAVLGTFNTTTSYLTVNNVTSTIFTMNTSTGEWGISVSDILENVTTTYSYVGWSDEGVSSTIVSIDILYEPEVIEIIETLTSPTILSPIASATYITSTIEIVVAGIAPTGTAFLVFDAFDATSSIPIADNAWRTSVRFPGTGSYELSVYGVDEKGVNSVTSSLSIEIECNTQFGYTVFSEIAWMGTEASPNDEWFEIMMIPPDVSPDINPGVQPGESVPLDLEMFRIVWGDYDAETGSYPHNVIMTQEKMFSVYGSDLPIDVGLGSGAFQSTPTQHVFERTDQSTLSNAQGIIYTGALGNDGEHMLILLGNIILDEVDASGGWFAGDNDTKNVMFRTDPTRSGDTSDAWCTFDTCSEDTLYIGEQLVNDADGNLVNGSPYTPYVFYELQW